MTRADADRDLVERFRAAVIVRVCASDDKGCATETYAQARRNEEHALRNLLAVLQGRAEMLEARSPADALRDSAALVAKGRRLEREDIEAYLEAEADREDGKTMHSEGAQLSLRRVAAEIHWRGVTPNAALAASPRERFDADREGHAARRTR